MHGLKRNIAVRSRQRFNVEQLAPWLLPDIPRGEAAPPIDWATLFGNERPVEIEVGFGKGMHLIQAAVSSPDSNFLGIEIDRKCDLYTAARVAVRQLPNVKLACADALEVLTQRVAPASVAVVHVYFPDPWWKQRHRKRRVFTAEFVEQVARVLRPAGLFHIATDVEPYFEVIQKLLGKAPAFQAIAARPATEGAHDMDYMTNFERKARRKGKPVFRAAYVKA